MSVKITALSENISDNPELLPDFGLSLYIEINDKTILLDTGSTGKCLNNAEKLGFDLSKLDAVVLSHGHFDHTDGLVNLIENGIKTVPVYFNRYMFCERYWRRTDDGDYYFPTMSGLSPSYLQRNKITFKGLCGDVYRLFADEDAYILSNIERVCDFEEICPDDYIKSGGGFIVDTYRDECVLVIDLGNDLAVLTGCGHHGVINICRYASKVFGKPVSAFIGGTHLAAFGSERIEKTVSALKNLDLKILAAGHCTGPEAMSAFKALPFFIPLHTGTKINL